MQMREKLQTQRKKIKVKSPNKWLISSWGIQTEPTTAEQVEQTTVSAGRDTNVRILRCANVHFVVRRRHSWQACWGFCVFVKAHICVCVHVSAVFLFSPCVPRCTSERTPLTTRSVGYHPIVSTWLVLWAKLLLVLSQTSLQLGSIRMQSGFSSPVDGPVPSFITYDVAAGIGERIWDGSNANTPLSHAQDQRDTVTFGFRRQI